MAAYRDVQAKAVKDVPAETFIKAYAAHLKSTDKVSSAVVGEVVGGAAVVQQQHKQRAPWW